MNQLVIFISVLVVISGCNRKVGVDSAPIAPDSLAGVARVVAPQCILQKIDSIKQQKIWNPPAEIHEYELAGKRVYAVSADCCDRFTTAVDSDCNYLCAPAGGFTGRGEGKCPDFFKNAKYARLVWKDERSQVK